MLRASNHSDRLRLGDAWKLNPVFTRSAERVLGLDELNDIYFIIRQTADTSDPLNFVSAAMKVLDIRCHIAADDLVRIPSSGTALIVANHPFGAVEGLFLASAIARVRPDFRLLANYILSRIPELRSLFLFVDPFGGKDAAKRNQSAVRDAMKLLCAGGLLAIFPAGEVSHLSARGIADPAWDNAAARLARRTGATVTPVYFPGHNRVRFQTLGLIHPRLRTLMLIRELLAQRGKRFEMRVGNTIPSSKIAECKDVQELTGYLRHRTYLLKHRSHEVTRRKSFLFSQPGELAPIAEPMDASLVAAEVESAEMLAENGDLGVYLSPSSRIPNLLQEIGRLREITFRATGEGTGKSIDLDTYDYDYLHLFVWNRAKRELVGAYRLGLTDLLLKNKGQQGIYTSTLFDYSNEAVARIDPAIELGRSFVRSEYQKAYAPLLLLWKGIAQFVVRNPKYKHLFGPVSISNTYQSISKRLMVRFLQLQHSLPNARKLVTARNPFRDRRADGLDDQALQSLLRDEADVSDVVSQIEPDRKGIPVLLRQYLKLGAKVLAINVDPDFSDCVDGLLMVDLTKTKDKILRKYMAADGLAAFRKFHQ